jgi:hypothetical protein
LENIYFGFGSRDSVVGIATGYGLDDKGIGVRVPLGQEFSLLHVVQTDTGAHPVSCRMGNGALSPGVKRQGSEFDQSSPTGAEVKKMWIYTSTVPYAFMA